MTSSNVRRRVAARGRSALHGLFLVLGAAACSERATAPAAASVACAGDGSSLALLQGATFDCGNGGTTLTLAGGGASYLIVPEFATENAPKQSVAFTIGVGAGAQLASASRAAPAAPSLNLSVLRALAPAPRALPGARQRAFDVALRGAERANLASWRPQRAAVGTARSAPSAAVAALPSPGSLRAFHVLSTNNAQHPTFRGVTARLAFAGANVLLYVDTLAPPNGFTAAQLTAVGQLFDETLYPIDSGAFGQPSDVDQNGRLIMLLSPVVNALSPAATCATDGFVGGFFDGFDLVSADTSSNRGEIFYSLVPDPNATVGCAHTIADLLAVTPAIFLHELQHLIDFSQHVVVHSGQPEEGWLDEGMSILAEELGAVHYEQLFPPPTGRTNPNQLFPDSAQGFIQGFLPFSYAYLLRPDTATVLYHSDSEDGFSWRGGDWLLVRWLTDQKGMPLLKRLEQSSAVGTDNIAQAAGEPFAGLFADFGLALYADSIPGVARSSIPTRDRFATRTLRRLYQAYFNGAGPSTFVPRPFPILLTSITTTPLAGSMPPGTMAFYRLDTAAGGGSVTIRFTAPGGATLDAGLHPLVSVFRIPPT